jgi:hypothetical protein
MSQREREDGRGKDLKKKNHLKNNTFAFGNAFATSNASSLPIAILNRPRGSAAPTKII